FRQRLGHGSCVYVLCDDRNHAFVVRCRMREFTTADDGSNRVRRKHKNENVSGFDCAMDSLHEFFRWPNTLPIDPCFSAPTLQRLIQAMHEVPVLASVGNEDVRHFLSAIVLAILRLLLASLTSKLET